MGSFYSRLSYSFGNEDWETEQKALKINSTDRILCVTASGDRPLNLLTKDLKEIVSVDANPLQNALFDLKKTAMKTLSYSEYLAFIGAEEHNSRLKTYLNLETNLDQDSMHIWRHHHQKIKRGVLYEGAVEKCLKIASFFMRQLRGKKIHKLFSFDDLEKQKAFLESEWHTFFWKKTFDVALNPRISRIFIKDPGLYAYVDPNIHVGKYLYERVHSALGRFLAKESIFMSLFFKGKVEKTNYPPYLSERGVDTIKHKLDCIQFQTIDLLSYLEKSPSNSFDCFSMSDVASYLDTPSFGRLIRGIFRTARPGARFCIRQFLSNHQIPDGYDSLFKRDCHLENLLENEDRCLVYRFMVGTIQK